MTKNNLSVRSEWFHCRLSDSEYRALKIVARINGTSITETARKIFRDHFKNIGLPPMGQLAAYSDEDLSGISTYISIGE